MESIKNFLSRFHTHQKLIVAFCLMVILCTMYRDCVLCTYVPKLDGFYMRGGGGAAAHENFYAAGGEDETAEDFENMGKPTMVLFYAPWCPHCKSMMGDWAKLKTKAPKHIKIAKVNCDEKPHLASKHQVKGFPTIILFKDGQKHTFEGPRNLENFLNFLQNKA
jgi:protein disulfide-isomerase-like protein